MHAALLFDLDGVLWSSNAAHEAAYTTVCEANDLVQLPFHQLAGMTTPDAFRLIVASTSTGCDASIDELVSAKRHAFLANAELIAGHEVVLRDFVASVPQVKRGLVTGASLASANVFLSRLSPDVFHVVITAADGLPGKPRPDAYLAAASRLNVQPEDCVVFEDSTAGMESAYSAGMQPVHVRGSECHVNTIPHEICTQTLSDALRLIADAILEGHQR